MTELQMNITQWEGSEAVGDEYETPEEGPAYCLITDARYDRTTFTYTISLFNLNTGKDIRPFRYTMKKAGEDGSIAPNTYSEATLISVGKAIFGQHVGVPYPNDIIGGVVLANVKLREYNGKVYANVYKYDEVPADLVEAYGSIVQYSSDRGVVAPPNKQEEATEEATEEVAE